MDKCKSCGAEIVWVVMNSGKMMPCDPKLYTIVTVGGLVVKGYESHFATCPQSDTWKKGENTL